MTLWAHWSPASYGVTLNTNGGTINAGNVTGYTYGTGATLPTNVTKTGYTFGGWYAASNFSGSPVTSIGTTETGAKTFYAKWNANSYTVTYNGNGNSGGSTESSSHVYDTPKALTANGFTRQYTVSFDANGGSECAAKTATYTFSGWNTLANGTGASFSDGASVSTLAPSGTITLYAQWNNASVTLPTPTRTGYTFGGWFTAKTGGTQVTSDAAVNITSDQTIYAHWSINSYTVTFVSNGGSAVSSQSVDYGQTAAKPDDPTKTGYTFGGWYNGSSLYNFNTPVTESVALTAKWTANKYTVNFDPNEGSCLTASKTVTYDGSYGELPAPTRTGYTFGGWFTAKTGGTQVTSDAAVNITSDQTIYAHWSINSYTVTFVSNGGSAVSSQSVDYGQTAAKPADPTKTGYTFTEWCSDEALGTAYDFGTPIAGNITLYAKWNANAYTVTYNGNGHTGGSTESSSHVYDTPKALTVNGFTRQYTVSFNSNGGSECAAETAVYSFNGWNTLANGTGASYSDGASVSNLTDTPSGTIILYAQWSSVSVTLPTPTRTGYTFGGWCIGDVKVGTGGESCTPTANITLTAKWNANAYTVTYDGNGHTGGSTADSTHIYNTESTLTANGFKREYTVSFNSNGGSECAAKTATYTFSGWNTLANGTGASFSDGASVSNLTDTPSGTITLYAQWSSVSVTLPTPTRTGYTFDGWYADPGSTGDKYSAGASYTPTANAVFYAVWSCVHIYGEEKTPSAANLKEPATCTDKAVYYKVCARCGDVHATDTYEYGAPSGHKYGGSPDWDWADDYSSATAEFFCQNDGSHTDVVNAAVESVIVGVTCTADGVKKYTATVTYNGNTYTDVREVAESAAGHSFPEAYTTDKAPTCTTEGEESVHCAVCGAIKAGTVRSIDKLPHTYGEPVLENKTEAGCTEGGSYDEAVYCTVCNTELNREHKTTDAVGHIAGEWQVKTPATEEAEGLEIKPCAVCGEVLETRATEKLTHDDGSIKGKVETAADEGAHVVDVDPIPSDEIIGSIELTSQEQESVAGCDNFEIVLEVKSVVEENVPAEDKVRAEETAKNSDNEIEMFIDMELILKNLTTGEERKITEANGLITIVINIPDEIYSDSKTYSVVRVHDGAAENIGGKLDRENRTLTIKTDKFSTYALASNDVPAGADANDNTNPNTGVPLGCVGSISLSAAAIAVVSKKKKNKQRQ